MIKFTKTEPYTGPFPRGKHYHRCPKCFASGGGGVNCYKSGCTLPRDLKVCSWCGHGRVEHFTPEPVRLREHRADCNFLKPAADQGPCNCEQLRCAEFFKPKPVAVPAIAAEPEQLGLF